MIIRITNNTTLDFEQLCPYLSRTALEDRQRGDGRPAKRNMKTAIGVIEIVSVSVEDHYIINVSEVSE